MFKWLENELGKVENDVKAVNWTALAAWYTKACAGLDQAVTVAETVNPALAPACALLSAAVSGAGIAAANLTTLAKGYKVGGSVTLTQLTAAASAADSAYVTASRAVGVIVAEMKTAPAAVPTTAAPAVPAAK